MSQIKTDACNNCSYEYSRTKIDDNEIDDVKTDDNETEDVKIDDYEIDDDNDNVFPEINDKKELQAKAAQPTVLELRQNIDMKTSQMTERTIKKASRPSQNNAPLQPKLASKLASKSTSTPPAPSTTSIKRFFGSTDSEFEDPNSSKSGAKKPKLSNKQ